MPWFFYNRGSKDIFASGLLPIEAYSKIICFGFELTEAVWLHRVKKTLNPFAAAQTILIFFFSEHPHTPSKSFLLLPLHPAFVPASPPLHRRSTVEEVVLWPSLHLLHFRATPPHRCCIVPPTSLLRCSASATVVSFRQCRYCAVPPAPLRCHFTVDEIVPVPLLLRLLQATITKVLLHVVLHSACTVAALPLHCRVGYSDTVDNNYFFIYDTQLGLGWRKLRQ